jgi:hypothetical protein
MVSLSYPQRRCLEQLAKARGKMAACLNCGLQRVGVLAHKSNWISGKFLVAVECFNCRVGAGDFFISAEEARNCGLDPNADLPDIPDTGI